MKHNVHIFKLFLISGIVIAFLLVSNEGKTEPDKSLSSRISQKGTTDIGGNHLLKDSNGTEKIKSELKNIKSLDPIQLNFRLVGTVVVGDENSYVVIEDETTGKQGMYKLGESINEAKVLKIDKECIIVEKDGRILVLKITGGSYSEITDSEVEPFDGPPSKGISEKLSVFEPIITENGPPSIGVSKALPPFEPINREGGPPSIGVSEELPPFEPIVLGPNPPVFESLDSEKVLPDK